MEIVEKPAATIDVTVRAPEPPAQRDLALRRRRQARPGAGHGLSAGISAEQVHDRRSAGRRGRRDLAEHGPVKLERTKDATLEVHPTVRGKVAPASGSPGSRSSPSDDHRQRAGEQDPDQGHGDDGARSTSRTSSESTDFEADIILPRPSSGSSLPGRAARVTVTIEAGQGRTEVGPPGQEEVAPGRHDEKALRNRRHPGRRRPFPLDSADHLASWAGPCRAPPRRKGSGPEILIGRDTRESGSVDGAGARPGRPRRGGEAVSAGVIPTSAVSYLTEEHGFSAGVVISASHNPFRDNGIKIFSPHGVKIPDDWEARARSGHPRRARSGLPGHEADVERRRRAWPSDYADFLTSRVRRPPARRDRISRSSSTAPTARAPSSRRASSATRLRRRCPSTTRRTEGTSTPAAARSIPRAWRHGSVESGGVHRRRLRRGRRPGRLGGRERPRPQRRPHPLRPGPLHEGDRPPARRRRSWPRP